MRGLEAFQLGLERLGQSEVLLMHALAGLLVLDMIKGNGKLLLGGRWDHLLSRREDRTVLGGDVLSKQSNVGLGALDGILAPRLIAAIQAPRTFSHAADQ